MFPRFVSGILLVGLIAAVLAAVPYTPAAAQNVVDEERATVLFVVDTSGSMAGTRIQQAQDALRAGIDSLESDQSAGLRSFSGGCGSGATERVPIGEGNSTELTAAVNGLTTGGFTPTPSALQDAADALRDIDGRRVVVLISDGQSSCGDPCPTAEQISADLGVDFRAITVGFQAAANAETELQCIADATGGQYFPADDAEGLAEVINDAVEGNLCTDNLIVCYAPEVRFHPEEAHFPMNPSDFIDDSQLVWAADVGCSNPVLANDPSPEFITSIYFAYERNFFCREDTSALHTTADFTRPFEEVAGNGTRRPAGLDVNEGFYLRHKDGPTATGASRIPVANGNDTIETPVWVEQFGNVITYWFFYGFDPKNPTVPADGVLAHEGDWERIQVVLDGNDAEEVIYYGHGCSFRVPYEETLEDGSDTHPIVYSALGAHASYDDTSKAVGTFFPNCEPPRGLTDETVFTDDSVVWRTWELNPDANGDPTSGPVFVNTPVSYTHLTLPTKA